MTTSSQRPDAPAADLRGEHRGPVLAAQDDGYDQARRAWNAMVDRRPALIAQCLDADDVATAIAFGRRHGLELGVKGGGHSVLGQAVPDGGLMIDLGHINAVRVDADRRLAHVGGGALLGDLDRASLEHGLATTAGNVSHTGVGGLTLGGGMGWLARQFGMACDNVAAYELVTAGGERLTASETQNQDLFWGLRGGGGNFGVVTSFSFRLHPLVDRALSADFFFPAEHGPQVLRFYREFSAAAPRQATPTAWIGTAADWPFLPPELHGKALANVGFVWVGDPEDGRALVPQLREAGVPAAEVVEETSYLELQQSGDEAMRHQMRRYWKGHYLRTLPDEALDTFLQRGGPADEGGIVPNGSFQTYGGAIGEVGIGDSAFSHRDALFEFIVMAGWEDPAEDAGRMGGARRYATAMEPHASGVYVNGLSDEGAAGVRHAYYAETLARLTALKDRYDPDNVFHLNHNIVPSS
ncbi:MAG: FAD-binding oxidoreductase [Candidatus Limnocylindria bacterium]